MKDALVKAITDEIIRTASEELLNRLEQKNVVSLAEEIADYKRRYDDETDPAEKRELEKDIRFLASRLLLRSEIKKLKLAKKFEAGLKLALKTALKSQFPFLV